MRREAGDFHSKEAWQEYVDLYWKAQSEHGQAIEKLDALTPEEQEILRDWVFFGERPSNGFPEILKPIIEGSFQDWVKDMFNQPEITSGLDWVSISELFSWFYNEAPNKCWADENVSQWTGVVD
jgi:hypothetical protein